MSNQALEKIEYGNKYPYDRDDEGRPIAKTDLSVKIARGILHDLLDRRGIKWALEDVDIDIRVEIVTALADVIRAGVNNEIASLKSDKRRIQAILLALIKTIDASHYGEDGLHHHTCPTPDHGKCTCGAYEAINLARPVEYEK